MGRPFVVRILHVGIMEWSVICYGAMCPAQDVAADAVLESGVGFSRPDAKVASGHKGWLP